MRHERGKGNGGGLTSQTAAQRPVSEAAIGLEPAPATDTPRARLFTSSRRRCNYQAASIRLCEGAVLFIKKIILCIDVS